MLERRDYQEPGQRKRFEYHLTPKGADLYPVLTALRQWGDKYLVGPEGPQSLITHKDCGAGCTRSWCATRATRSRWTSSSAVPGRVRACAARPERFLAGRDEFSRGRWSYGA